MKKELIGYIMKPEYIDFYRDEFDPNLGDLIVGIKLPGEEHLRGITELTQRVPLGGYCDTNLKEIRKTVIKDSTEPNDANTHPNFKLILPYINFKDVRLMVPHPRIYFQDYCKKNVCPQFQECCNMRINEWEKFFTPEAIDQLYDNYENTTWL